MARRRRHARPTVVTSGAELSLADYGRPDLPAFSWDGLPGDSGREKARAYVDMLDLEPSAERAYIIWRVECALEDAPTAAPLPHD